jgi:aspartate racemase
LLKGINNLAAGGATFAALTGITPHIVFDRLQAESPITLISMMATTVDYLQKHHYQRVLLLGTYPTMHEGFFRNDLVKHGIKVTVPTDEEQEQVNTLIEKELEYGVVSTTTKNKLRSLCSYYQKHSQVDAVVLGCTELPLAFDQLTLNISTVDVMDVHIHALVKRLLEPSLK